MAPLTWHVDNGAESVLVTAHGKGDSASTGAFSTMLAGRNAQGAMLIDISAVTTVGPHSAHVVEAVRRRGAAGRDSALLVSASLAAGKPGRAGNAAARPPLIRCLADTRSALIVGQPWVGRPAPRSLGDVLLPVAGAARHARDLVTEACAMWDMMQLAGSASVVASELINHAVDQANTIMDFTVARDDAGLYIGVRYGTGGAASPGYPPHINEYGFSLINAMATHWGFLAVDDNTTVWARLFIEQPPRQAT